MSSFFSDILIKLKLKDPDPLQAGISNGYAPYEELEGKKTTTLGMVFVVIMVLAGIWQGQVLLRSIQSTIHPPENFSTCFYDIVSRGELQLNTTRDHSYSTYGSRQYNALNYRNYGSGANQPCNYSSIENKYSFASIYESIKPKILEVSVLNQEIQDLNSKIRTEERQKTVKQQDYNTSLFENISGTESPVYSSEDVSAGLVVTEDTLTTLKKLLVVKTDELASKNNEIKQTVIQSSSVLKNISDEYSSKIKWLEIKRFLTSFILLAPLVWFTLRRYFRAKNERSEYSVIWGGAALISAILFGQVLVIFVYRILPIRLIEALVEFLSEILQSFSFLWILLQWAGFILIPLFFGFLVYKIQKKFYNPLAVAMRALKEGKCPKCSMKIKDSMVHCPMCSFDVRVTCPSCSSTSVCFAKFCENCGKVIPVGVGIDKETTK